MEIPSNILSNSQLSHQPFCGCWYWNHVRPGLDERLRRPITHEVSAKFCRIYKISLRSNIWFLAFCCSVRPAQCRACSIRPPGYEL